MEKDSFPVNSMAFRKKQRNLEIFNEISNPEKFFFDFFFLYLA